MNSFDFADLKLPLTPWPHQGEEWAASLGMRERGLLWEMGTGKTLTALVWARLKYRQEGRLLKTLIISPVATLENWKRAFEKNAPPSVYSSVRVASGPGAKRAALIADPSVMVVIANPEALTMPAVLSALRQKGFELIIVDEAHRFKSHDSKRFKNLISFSDRAKYRMILTGTFILNNYMDVWAPLRFLDKGETFGTNFYSHFRRKYFFDANAGMALANPSKYFPDWRPIEGLEQIVADKISAKVSRRTKEECLNLPPRVFVRVPVELSKEQKKLYTQMENELIAMVDENAITATNALTKVLRMQQILSGFVKFEEDGREAAIADNPRLAQLREILEDRLEETKVVVWVQFKKNYEDIRALLDKMGVGFSELTGETKDRQGAIDKFVNDPACRVFLSNPQAGGTGVDGLQHVSTCAVYYTRSYSLGDRLQSLDRIHRGGSEKHAKVTIIDLVAEGTLDEEILNALDKKEEFAEDVLGRIRARKC